MCTLTDSEIAGNMIQPISGLQIQLSEDTWDHINSYFPVVFETVQRGQQHVKVCIFLPLVWAGGAKCKHFIYALL